MAKSSRTALPPPTIHERLRAARPSPSFHPPYPLPAPSHPPSRPRRRARRLARAMDVAALPAAPAAPPPSLTDGAAPDPHADDSYCSLCRRCQMRKKLERRLAAKKDSGALAPPALAGHAHATDQPSLDELLQFIGDDKPPGASRRLRNKKRSAVAAARALEDGPYDCARDEDDDGDLVDGGPEPVSSSAATSTSAQSPPRSPCDDEHLREHHEQHLPQQLTHAEHQLRYQQQLQHLHDHRPKLQQHNLGHDSPVSDVAEVGLHAPCCGGDDDDAMCCDPDADADDEGMTPEEREALDAEVEEFRLRLVC
jgi:hypothetical protein